MSEWVVTQALGQPGFWGKVPTRGDFVSRRLPRQFIDSWDTWLGGAFAASREQLGAQWLDLYLTSPIWRFGCTAGLLGDKAWAGVLMPSVDKVGRYFPLTLAVPLAEGRALPLLFDGASGWFETVEQLALSALEDAFDLERFDAALQQATLSESAWIPAQPENYQGETERGKFAVQASVAAHAELPSAFAAISASTLERFLPAYSLWRTEGAESFPPSLLVCEGLPPVDAYVGFLTGQWPQRGWSIKSWHRTAPLGRTQATQDKSVTGPLIVSSVREDMGQQWRWISHGISEVGRRRRVNQDAFIERPDIRLWAVADGMGGHQAGEFASATVVDALAAIPAAGNLEQAVAKVKAALAGANSNLWALAEETEDGQIIGSTVVVLLAVEGSGAVLWAGDSRLYRYRSGSIEQLTRDHSLVEDAVAAGVMEGAGRGKNTRCNVITRAVGAEPTLDVDLLYIEFVDGDRYLLCSDGLDKELEPSLIGSILGRGDCQTSAKALIDEALEQGARDNVTVVVLHCDRIS